MTVDKILAALLSGLIIAFFANAWHSIRVGNRLTSLFEIAGDELTPAEQLRLDGLLNAGKRYYNLSVVVALLLLSISTLTEFQRFEIPMGGISFPKIETVVGLHVLTIALVVVADRFFLMAYPWLRFDPRRPPHDWVVMGLAYERTYKVGAWIYIPIAISSAAITLALREDVTINSLASFPVTLVSSSGLAYLPRSLYYWRHLISNRLDHRGGAATLSIYLLYVYRYIRQVIFSLYIAYPMVLVIPAWDFPEYVSIVKSSIPFLLTLSAVRWIGMIHPVYRAIDRVGRRFSFAFESPHYR